MIALFPAVSEQHYEELLELVYHQKSAYLEPKLDLIDLTWDQFHKHFISTGVAYRILVDGSLAGLCWVERKNELLEILGLVIRAECQGLGVGTYALQWLERTYQNQVRAILLQVHVSNPRARALYERLGYQAVEYCAASGFWLIRKDLSF